MTGLSRSTSARGIAIVSAFLALARPALALGQSQADEIVQELRGLPTPLQAEMRSDGSMVPTEQRRRELYGRLRELGDDAVFALARGLSDSDVQLRRNATLALNALGGTWFDRSQPKMDIRAALLALMVALDDTDTNVRAWSAQAIGQIGSDAAPAVPALIELLSNEDEGSRNGACIALRGIGRAATEALPALRRALSDPSADVRGFAKRAIERIEGR
jgi:HEAT repeat protein